MGFLSSDLILLVRSQQLATPKQVVRRCMVEMGLPEVCFLAFFVPRQGGQTRLFLEQ